MLFPGMVQYFGNFRNYPTQGVPEKVVAATWFILIITLLFLGYYDTVYSKKEQMVRMALGADPIHIMVRKIISDILGFLIAAIILLLPFINPLFRWNVSLIGFLILLLCNSIVIILGMRNKGYLQIKSIASSRKALNISIIIEELIYDFANEISGKAINPSLVEFTIVNIGDWFKGLWSLQNRSLLIALVLTLLILILEMQISNLSLGIAYETNAKELTIKKVMGYSKFERFKSFFLLTGVLCEISLVGALLCTMIFKISTIGYIAWGSLIVFLLDTGILLYLTQKNDNLQIQKVLKGGI